MLLLHGLLQCYFRAGVGISASPAGVWLKLRQHRVRAAVVLQELDHHSPAKGTPGAHEGHATVPATGVLSPAGSCPGPEVPSHVAVPATKLQGRTVPVAVTITVAVGVTITAAVTATVPVAFTATTPVAVTVAAAVPATGQQAPPFPGTHALTGVEESEGAAPSFRCSMQRPSQLNTLAYCPMNTTNTGPRTAQYCRFTVLLLHLFSVPCWDCTVPTRDRQQV